MQIAGIYIFQDNLQGSLVNYGIVRKDFSSQPRCAQVIPVSLRPLLVYSS